MSNPKQGCCNLKTLIWLIAVLLCLVVTEIWGSFQLYNHRLWGRFIKVDNLQSLRTNIGEQPSNFYYRKISGEPWVKLKDSKQQYLGALKWVMNQVKKINSNNNSDNDPVQLLKSVEAGEGALCDDMVALYRNVLTAIGRPSRKVWLYRDLMARFDTHVTVEVRLQSKWVIMDPTFGVSFSDANGQLLSAQEMKQYLLHGRYQDIQPVFYGDVSYPARIETYYLNYLPLFNNVFVVERKANVLCYLPLVCYWYGPRFYYEKLPFESDDNIHLVQQLYFIFALCLPVIMLLLFGFIMYRICYYRFISKQAT